MGTLRARSKETPHGGAGTAPNGHSPGTRRDGLENKPGPQRLGDWGTSGQRLRVHTRPITLLYDISPRKVTLINTAKAKNLARLSCKVL